MSHENDAFYQIQRKTWATAPQWVLVLQRKHWRGTGGGRGLDSPKAATGWSLLLAVIKHLLCPEEPKFKANVYQRGFFVLHS